MPTDIVPFKDELGEWHPPRLSGRYRADIEKQYYAHSLPWMWSPSFFEGKLHYLDREPVGLRRWYRREFKQQQAAEAMKRRDQMIEEYRRERREKKRLSWIESIVQEFAGSEMAQPYVRTRRIPKM